MPSVAAHGPWLLALSLGSSPAACAKTPSDLPPTPPASKEPDASPIHSEAEPADEAGEQPIEIDPEASAALLKAARSGDMVRVRQLAELGGIDWGLRLRTEFIPGAHELNGYTALALVARAGDVETLDLLVAKGAPLVSTVMVAAVHAGDADMVDHLLTLELEDRAEATTWGLTRACKNRDHALARRMLDAGADVDGWDYFPEVQTTCLGAAALSGDRQMVQLMLDHGADPNHNEDPALPPLTFVLLEGGDAATLQLLLDHGADLETPDAEGLRPLHHALNADDEDALRWLLDHGADPNAPGWEGELPLFTAATLDDLQLVKLLVQAGADLRATDTEGQTVLDVAPKGSKVAAYLKRKGARQRPK